MKHADVIVIGGGHAGCEAAAAAARMGAMVTMITMRADMVGAMSCNPAIGGIGKGHIVREVDAFDGIIGVAADEAAIHYRMLNARKGKAVQGPRVQADRELYRAAVRRRLAARTGVTILEGSVDVLLVDNGSVAGVALADGRQLPGSAIVLASGTFLDGRLFVGRSSFEGGRWNERPASSLGRQLQALGLPMGRMKTGTPPRLDGRTINWSRLKRQRSDAAEWTMSPIGARVAPQLFCGVTRTNAATHRLIRESMGQSPLVGGEITGRSPRYCPSLEDKVIRFPDRDDHQIFLEPEGLRSSLIYPNGISTSLPENVQRAMVRTIAGLEAAEVVVPGHAVEYSHVDPRVLDNRLAVRGLTGLFLAGQINGTTGYEEAAGQGLVAGLNAAALALGRPAVVLPRDQSYIGVMIDDLTLQGVSEPYRMLTARAEHRLHLRADNAEARLCILAKAAGCLSDSRLYHVARREMELGEIEAALKVLPDQPFDVNDRAGLPAELQHFSRPLLEEAMEDRRYAPYLGRQFLQVAAERWRDSAIPLDFDYRELRGLSAEMIERLEQVRPASIGEARRIRGLTAAAVSALIVGHGKSASRE